MMVEGAYTLPSLPAMRVKAQVGFDSGNMFGDNFGACVTIAYRGSLNFGKK